LCVIALSTRLSDFCKDIHSGLMNSVDATVDSLTNVAAILAGEWCSRAEIAAQYQHLNNRKLLIAHVEETMSIGSMMAVGRFKSSLPQPPPIPSRYAALNHIACLKNSNLSYSRFFS
jgi:hypothetical protein